MMKLDLEKSLMRQNERNVTQDEWLAIREYETHTELAEDDILNRIKVNQAVKEGERIQSELNRKKQETEKFKKERVFHISQIESICKKYYLKFLPSYLFNGRVDKDLSIKVANFETAYNVRCDVHDTFIAAPKSSFKLKERPKDPLLFYQINDEYFYLVHKWGNDLNIFRRLLSIFSDPYISAITMLAALALFLLIPGSIGLTLWATFSIIFVILVAVMTIGEIPEDIEDKTLFRLVKRNNWKDSYKN